MSSEPGNTRAREPLAIVGMGCLFPGSLDEQGFWRDIVQGNDLMSDVPASHWLIEDYYDPDPNAPDKTYARRGGFLQDVVFDPIGWGIPPNIVPATDTSQLLALIVAQRVLDQATGGRFAEADKERTSVILGVTSAQELLLQMTSRLQRPIWVKALREAGVPESQVQAACDRIAASYTPWQEASFPGLLGNVVAGRIANRLDLHGTNCVVDAACASSLSALAMAAQELWLGDSDLVVAGGVETLNDIFMYVCFSKTPALSASGDCRPFSDDADGTMLGEGLGMVAIKRLSDARRDGDRIYCTIAGIGSSSDGRAKSIYAPVSEGQARALRRAYERAGYTTDTVELVEAHGTGTKAGDVAEFDGLKLAFGDHADGRKQWCALGSVKSQIGHTKAAAGAAGLFKVAMALHSKILPPTAKVARPNPKLRVQDSPFYLNTRARPWIRNSEHPRRASVSSFGFGGSNFHVTLQEHDGAESAPSLLRTMAAELVVFSASDAAGLKERLQAALDDPRDDLGWASWRSLQHKHEGAARAAVICEDMAQLRARVKQALDHLRERPGEVLRSPVGVYVDARENAEDPGKIAFLFPGQGSQRVGMGDQLAMTFPAARAVWDFADDHVIADGGRLSERVFPPPVFDKDAEAAQQAALTATEWAQPALGACSMAAAAVLDDFGLTADMVAGHSYGEVTALWAAGFLDRRGMLAVSRKRGELMAQAAELPGAMLAVKASRAQVEAALEKAEAQVTVANHNAPDQVVLSGEVEAIDQAQAVLRAAGLQGTKLPVATAFHSPVVAQAEKPFSAFLKDVQWQRPTLTVLSNTEAAPYPASAARARQVLAGQVSRPVRFVEMIERMWEDGARTFVEVGAGGVLTSLTGRILGEKAHLAVAIDRKGKDGTTALWHALAALFCRGLALDLTAAWRGYAQPVDPATTPRPRLALAINGANHGKPYPPAGGASALPSPNPEPAPAPALEQVMSKPESAQPTAAAVPPQHPQPAAPAESAAAAMSPSEAAHWVQAFAQAQQQTATAHAAWQQAMTQAHMQFLRASEQALSGLQAMVTGQPLPAPPPVPAALPGAPTIAAAPIAAAPIAAAPIAAAPIAAAPIAPAPIAPAPMMPPAYAVAPPAPTPAPAPPVHTATVSAPLPAPAPAAPAPRMPAAPAPVPAAKPAARGSGEDPGAALLAVVADKTGYPADMLELSMALEADLGIDSIKRVEILAALQDRLPSMPEVDAAEAGELQTLGEILERIAGGATAATSTPANGVPATTGGSNGAIDLQATLLAVVADKTGYPADMLELSMALEADLGIDSIKRVEILAALQDADPTLPELDGSGMAELTTLGAIVEAVVARRGGRRESSDDAEGDIPTGRPQLSAASSSSNP